MTTDDLRALIAKEIASAECARAEGNEGRARVHARRAAGVAAQMYRMVYFPIEPRLSGFRHLKRITADINLPDDLRAAAARLTVRVTPEHTLPHVEDPLEDAQYLADALLARLTQAQ